MNKFYMNDKDILKYLNKLNDKMKENNIYGDINLVGGAVMCLAFKSRNITVDIDAVFEPKNKINNLIEEIAIENNLPDGWLNDGVKGFLSNKGEFQPYLLLPNLNINIASLEYMLAMKCLSARVDNVNEVEDIKFLIKELNLKSYQEVEKLILKYYPSDQFLIKTKYLLMEVIENVWT